MKALLTALLLGSAPAFGQVPAAYPELLDQAGQQLQRQDYCAATATFAQAFATDSTRANEFELYAGASAAARCPIQHSQAWRWLGQLSRRTLHMQPHDLDQLAQGPELAPLATNTAWPRWLAAMRQNLAAQAAATQAASRRWLTETQARALPMPTGSRRGAAPASFALYFSAVPHDTVRVPYLVRVPATYNPAQPAPVVVYLHGGVVSTPQFRYADPGVAAEPVFAAAPANALVVYPFGRQSFGWVQQPAAFAQVQRIVAEVQARYRTDPRRTVLGGMSNGGSAALWFASQQPEAFSGFYALSPASELPLHAPLGQLGQAKLCYQLSAQDDALYPFATVQALHDRAHAPRWQLQVVPSGGHGFLYSPAGPELLRHTLALLLN